MTYSIKKIPNFEGYLADTDGNIWSEFVIGGHGKKSNEPRQLKQSPSNSRRGYMFVCLRKHGRNYLKSVHTLVLETFDQPRPPEQECRHLNGNKWDNRLANLKWGTREENIQDKFKHGMNFKGERNPSARLTAPQVKFIKLSIKLGRSVRSLAREFSVSRSAIRYIKTNKTWGHLVV